MSDVVAGVQHVEIGAEALSDEEFQTASVTFPPRAMQQSAAVGQSHDRHCPGEVGK
jgi:hypothetical protein